MKKLEPLWYELSPYLYGTVGGGAIFFADGALGNFSGILLLTAAATIVGMRTSYRNLKNKKPRRVRR